METLYHGLDIASVERWKSEDGVRDGLGIDADSPVVGTIAIFRPQKRHWSAGGGGSVRERIPNVRFLFVGQGPMEDQVKKRAWQMGLKDTVVFAGYRTDVPQVLASLDVFALSSGWEGLSIALLEAMACGLPAVASRVGGVSEVIEDGKSGLLVPPDDPHSMADEIIRMLGNRSLAEKLGAEARLRARRFDIRATVRREEAVYAELLAMNSRTGYD